MTLIKRFKEDSIFFLDVKKGHESDILLKSLI